MAAAPPQPPPSSNEDVRMRLQSEVAKYSVKFRETKKQQQDAEDPEMTARRLKNVQQVSVQIRPHRCLDRVHDMLEGLSSLPPRLKGTGRLLVRCLLSQPGSEPQDKYIHMTHAYTFDPVIPRFPRDHPNREELEAQAMEHAKALREAQFNVTAKLSNPFAAAPGDGKAGPA